MSDLHSRVVKVGGSLFDLPDLAIRLRSWLDRQAPIPTLFVAGGGAHAELIRAADARWSLAPDIAHDLALQGMHINGRLLAALLSGPSAAEPLPVIADLESWAALRSKVRTSGPVVAVADMAPILRRAESQSPGGVRLVERSWRVTSDSLAAWLASRLADHHDPVALVELVLLKSAGIRPGSSLAECQQRGVVDETFHTYAAVLQTVRLVNVREPEFAETMVELERAPSR